MSGAIPPLPQYAFMAWCSVKHRDNSTFTFTLPFTVKAKLKNLYTQKVQVPAIPVLLVQNGIYKRLLLMFSHYFKVMAKMQI
jgi:hypothetical protein